MVNELAEKKSDNIAILLVADYDSPGQMTSAISSAYLISPAIKSPMGANLSGFTTEDNALAAKGESEGKVYTWVALLKKFDAE
jgi:copper chaperone NosL